MIYQPKLTEEEVRFIQRVLQEKIHYASSTWNEDNEYVKTIRRIVPDLQAKLQKELYGQGLAKKWK